jgi:release factor glutamine methyltransferase
MTAATGTATAIVARGAAALSVAAARRLWTTKFRDGGIEAPELDARLIVEYALGLDYAGLVAASTRILSAGEQRLVTALARRRLAREPMARIAGAKEFWSLPLRIDAATLVPRPETETVVETALAAIDGCGGRTRALRIADLGTGCGAILLALLSELPNAFGVGTDMSLRALAIARDNARRLRLTRATFIGCDMASALDGPFDVIVSNPPYIASADISALAPEVRNFDPRAALDGGADGLKFYRAIAATAPPLLASDGVLVVELGAGQSGHVAAMFAAAGLAPLPPYPDLGSVPRVLMATKGHEHRALGPGKKALGMSGGSD